jgi:hypothetical protein
MRDENFVAHLDCLGGTPVCRGTPVAHHWIRLLGNEATDRNCIHEEIKSRQFRECIARPLSRKVRVKIHKIIIVSLVLYGCWTWYLTWRVEHRLRVFEKWVIRRIFGHKRDEVTGGWRLRNEELHSSYSSSDNRVIKSRRMRWTEHVARVRERLLVGNPKWKRPLGRSRHIWEYNIHVAPDRDQWRFLVNTAMYFGFQKSRGISWLAERTVSFSRRTLLHGVNRTGLH